MVGIWRFLGGRFWFCSIVAGLFSLVTARALARARRPQAAQSFPSAGEARSDSEAGAQRPPQRPRRGGGRARPEGPQCTRNSAGGPRGAPQSGAARTGEPARSRRAAPKGSGAQRSSPEDGAPGYTARLCVAGGCGPRATGGQRRGPQAGVRGKTR